MFFITKSALCIGAVAVLAAGVPSGGDLRASAVAGGEAAAATLGRACAASHACVEAGARVLATAVPQAGAVPAAAIRAGIAEASQIPSRREIQTAARPTADAARGPSRSGRPTRRLALARD